MHKVTRPTPSHFGIYVMDLKRMTDFYVSLFGLTVTDSGRPAHFPRDLVFLSASKEQHHQLVLASGRPAGATFSNVMQISFMVPAIGDLRDIWKKAEALGATNIRGINHGNSLSVYFSDGKVKVELALARGKRDYDKRQDMARRDAQREVVRSLGRHAKGMS